MMLMMNFLQKEEHGARREQNVPAWENQVWRGRAGQGSTREPSVRVFVLFRRAQSWGDDGMVRFLSHVTTQGHRGWEKLGWILEAGLCFRIRQGRTVL